jgi:hypothetical protein
MLENFILSGRYLLRIMPIDSQKSMEKVDKVTQLSKLNKCLPSSSFTPWSLGSSMSSASAKGILPMSGTR